MPSSALHLAPFACVVMMALLWAPAAAGYLQGQGITAAESDKSEARSDASSSKGLAATILASPAPLGMLYILI